MQCTRPVWIHPAWKTGNTELAQQEAEEWVVEVGLILEGQVDTEEGMERIRITTRAAEQTVVELDSVEPELPEVVVVDSGREPGLEGCWGTCLETGGRVAMGGTTRAGEDTTEAGEDTTEAGVVVCGEGTEPTTMEEVLAGEVLPQEGGEGEEELPVQPLALVQGRLQDLGALGGDEDIL